MVAFTLNNQRSEVALDGDTPLLWVIREHLGLTGTKFGCGVASCGACTVHIDGKAGPLLHHAAVAGRGQAVTTIEGLSPDGSIRCRRPGSPSRCRNAATASPARSCRRRRCSPRNKTRRASRSSSTWTAISAAAAPIRRIISAIQRAAREG